MYLFFDTETTGLANVQTVAGKDPVRICQFAGMLCDKDKNVVNEFNFLIKPDNWEINKKASSINGLTTDMCENFGISMTGVLILFERLSAIADVTLAFNNKYDLHMLDIEQYHYKTNIKLSNNNKCVMKMAKNILKIPPTEKMRACGMHNYFKNPNLKETYRAFFNEDFENAHDALADVKATAKCYFYMLDKIKKLVA